MAHSSAEIDKELRAAGRIATLFIRPSRFGFWLVGRSLRAMVGRDMEDAVSESVDVPHSHGVGAIRTRVFRPKNAQTPLPVVLYFHGGGYAMGAPEQQLGLLKALMKVRPCVVVAPDYRLSVDAPYPAGLHDCYDALRWVRDNAETIGGRSDQIMLFGDSAGGGLAIACSLMARDRGEVNIAYQLPLYPMIDDRQTNPSAVGNTMPVWNSKHNKRGWALYLRDLAAQGKPISAYAAPARAESYAGLPPTTTFVGTLDPFFDETVQFVEKLRAENIDVRFETFAGGFHGFELLVPQAGISKAAAQFLRASFAHAVDNCFAPQHLN